MPGKPCLSSGRARPNFSRSGSWGRGIPRRVHQRKASSVLHVVCPLAFRDGYTRGRLVCPTCSLSSGIPRRVHQGKVHSIFRRISEDFQGVFRIKVIRCFSGGFPMKFQMGFRAVSGGSQMIFRRYSDL